MDWFALPKAAVEVDTCQPVSSVAVLSRSKAIPPRLMSAAGLGPTANTAELPPAAPQGAVMVCQLFLTDLTSAKHLLIVAVMQKIAAVMQKPGTDMRVCPSGLIKCTDHRFS